MSRSTVPRISWAAVTICIVTVVAAMVMPTAARASAPQAPLPCPSADSSVSLGTKTPVLFVHGFNETPDVWTTGSPSMAAAIAATFGADVQTFAFSYADEKTDWVTNEDIGRKLAECITNLAVASPLGKVVIVAHSMGGLAVRCAVDPVCVNTKNATGTPWPAANAKDIGLLITLGTPNTGPSAPLSALGQFLCNKIPGCPDLFGLVITPAGEAMIGLEPGAKTPTKLPMLPAQVPLDAIAGKITVKATLLTAGTFDVGSQQVDDFGDVVVPVASALDGAPVAGAPATAPHAGPGSGSTTEDCGTVRAFTLIGIANVPLNLSCWHETEITASRWQADIVNAIRAYLTTPATSFLPVATCPSRYGLSHGPARVPDEIATELPPDVAAELAFYTDQYRSIDPVLAPRGWACSAVLGVDGSGWLSAWPSGTQEPSGNASANPDQELVEADTAGLNQSEVYGYLCALDPTAAARDFPIYASNGGCLQSSPPGEQVVYPRGDQDPSLIYFDDPPGVTGTGSSSGGNYSADGVQLYAAPETGVRAGILSKETCLLPDSQHGLCTVILNDFIERQWMMSQSS